MFIYVNLFAGVLFTRVDVKETGNYMLCIDNTFSRFSRKIVFLEVLTDEPDPEWKGQDYMFANLEEDDGLFEVKLDDFRVCTEI